MHHLLKSILKVNQNQTLVVFPQRCRRMVTLLVATTADPASIGPASSLLAMPGWHPGPFLHDIPSFVNKNVRLLKHSNRIVTEDYLDKRWQDSVGEFVDEVIFLSRHTAVSNRPALTIHPIGVPHLRDDEVPPAGGKPGWAAPPNPRIGPWLRLLQKIADSHNLTPEFEVTLEATHHGPLVDSPTMFVEIGRAHIISSRPVTPVRSQCLETDNDFINFPDYQISDEIDVYAQRALMIQYSLYLFLLQLVWQGLGLGEEPAVGEWSRDTGKNKVLLGIGGGHYAPRHMDIVLKEGMWVGHLLSGYSLPMEDPSKSNDSDAEFVGGSWRQAIRVAYNTTKSAFPGGDVAAHLDHKSFKSWQRSAITRFLETENIKIGKPKDFL